MEDHNSPQREGDCASVPILITDSPEVSPGGLLGEVKWSPFKTVSDQGRKDFQVGEHMKGFLFKFPALA
jgi:hypothetical protein